MIKCLIFDWYGVCTPEPWVNVVARELEAKLGVPKDTTVTTFRKSLPDYLIDKISGEQFLEKVFTDLHIENHEGFLHLLDRHPDLNWDVLKLIKKLKERYITALYSDSFKGPFEKYEKQMGGTEGYFNYTFLSHRSGLHKGDEKAYKNMITTIGVEATKMVFVDDWDRNFVIAKRLGINCILFTSYSDLLEQFKHLGIL